jgi:hypothetical protein
MNGNVYDFHAPDAKRMKKGDTVALIRFVVIIAFTVVFTHRVG